MPDAGCSDDHAADLLLDAIGTLLSRSWWALEEMRKASWHLGREWGCSHEDGLRCHQSVLRPGVEIEAHLKAGQRAAEWLWRATLEGDESSQAQRRGTHKAGLDLLHDLVKLCSEATPLEQKAVAMLLKGGGSLGEHERQKEEAWQTWRQRPLEGGVGEKERVLALCYQLEPPVFDPTWLN